MHALPHGSTLGELMAYGPRQLAARKRATPPFLPPGAAAAAADAGKAPRVPSRIEPLANMTAVGLSFIIGLPCTR